MLDDFVLTQKLWHEPRTGVSKLTSCRKSLITCSKIKKVIHWKKKNCIDFYRLAIDVLLRYQIR